MTARMERTANYAIVEDTPEFIVIKDLGPWHEHMSVTNAAENVVAELADRLGHRRLFYIDSEGDVDELLVQYGAFAGFKAGGPIAAEMRRAA